MLQETSQIQRLSEQGAFVSGGGLGEKREQFLLDFDTVLVESKSMQSGRSCWNQEVQHSSENGGHGNGHAIHHRLFQKNDDRSRFQVVPDIERVVERLQHGLQHDGHVGAWLQEDQFLPDDSLCGDSPTRLRKGLRGFESHLVPVHTHALRVWGLRTLHVERKGLSLTVPFPLSKQTEESTFVRCNVHRREIETRLPHDLRSRRPGPSTSFSLSKPMRRGNRIATDEQVWLTKLTASREKKK